MPLTGDDGIEDVEVRRVLRVERDRLSANARKPAQTHGEDVLEDDREEEDRNRDTDQRPDQRQLVEDPAVSLRGEKTERDPEPHPDDHRPDGKLDRRGETRL